MPKRSPKRGRVVADEKMDLCYNGYGFVGITLNNVKLRGKYDME